MFRGVELCSGYGMRPGADAEHQVRVDLEVGVLVGEERRASGTRGGSGRTGRCGFSVRSPAETQRMSERESARSHLGHRSGGR